MRVIVDFDGTLALGNASHITLSTPNYLLITRLLELKRTINPYIVICTARGAKGRLSVDEKKNKYQHLITEFLETYNIPYDEISFNKEYGDLYIDDMTIHPSEPFSSFISPFTDNKILLTDNSVIKKSKSSLFEKSWYDKAKAFGFSVPKVLFLNDETIITQRIHGGRKPRPEELIMILESFMKCDIENYPFETYKQRLKLHNKNTSKVREIIENLKPHQPTFFHGDLSTSNVLVNDKIWMIDPNYKMTFGSYLTDAGKAYFSLIAYEQDWFGAQKLVDAFGDDIKHFAVAEGLRVSKYKPEYTSIINNIADEI